MVRDIHDHHERVRQLVNITAFRSTNSSAFICFFPVYMLSPIIDVINCHHLQLSVSVFVCAFDPLYLLHAFLLINFLPSQNVISASPFCLPAGSVSGSGSVSCKPLKTQLRLQATNRRTMFSKSQKSLHSLLANKLKKLTITPASASSSEFDFSEVFGPVTPHHQPNNQSPSSTSSIPAFVGDPQVIHNRSHSFVGPSPRYTLSSSLPLQIEEFELENDPEVDNENESQIERKIGPGDFGILRVVGQGAFGKVFQVSRKGDDSGDGIYAMKVMRKDPIIKKNHVEYMKAERDILTKVAHPFIVQLRFSFQTKSKLYLILDFINGGHLFFHLYRQGIFSEDQARFYTAEIVSAVSHLHKCGIVHRDLKPENILMDADGHVMLTDFGLAKEIDESSRSNSMCGTTEYMAPEILLSKGHNKDADWWSVGILLYEMLTGQPPFMHANRQKLQQRIINEKVKLPPFLTSEAHALLKGLLQKDPSRRLGSGPGAGDKIKHHKWFRSINWNKLEAREMLPKFKPDVSGKDCVANFDKCWTTMPADDSPATTPTAGEHFQGYTYVAPNPWLLSG